MNEPPVMISTKDLSYISDMFEWSFTAGKTANHFKDEVIDEEIKSILNEITIMHKNICHNLINLLEVSDE